MCSQEAGPEAYSSSRAVSVRSEEGEGGRVASTQKDKHQQQSVRVDKQ